MKKSLFLLLGFASLNTFVLLGEPIPGFTSIDCGATNNYSDSDYRIYYETDADYVDTGANKQVSTDHFSDWYDARSKNMRIFPNGTRNCYTLRPQQGKNNKYLIRASFFYGNYDGRNVTPVFDVHIDTNFWFMAGDSNYYAEELIYSLSRDYVQLCLINTGNGVPFISAIELRLLDKGIYPFESGALMMYERYALGSSAASIGYPDDPFDRFWYKGLISGMQAVTNTTVIEIDQNDNPYKVPIAVLETAQVSNDSQASISYTMQSNLNGSWYLYLYLAEIQVLQPNQSREFSVYIDNTFVTTASIMYSTLITIPSQLLTGRTTIGINLTPTARSTLSPIINALEIYTVLELPNPMTALEDFDAINDIRRTYGLAEIKESWQGDPCSPAIYMWSGLSCSNGSALRIVSLNLSSSGLTGLIAPALADLIALKSLDLSNNQLTGQVPDFLAQMQSLKILNLSGNNLNGSVPTDLMKKKANGTLQLSLEGNPNLCNLSYCPTTGSTATGRSNIAPIVASILAVVVGVLFVTIAVIWRYARKRGDGSRAGRLKIFTHSELEGITNNFRTIIGEGSFGKVYLGRLDDGTEVAVKVLSRMSRQGNKEFQAEAKLLMVVHHRNLVSLVGYCDDPKNMALVYEYMSNGNVRDHLSRREPPILSWPQRLQIAIDAAQGLEYLHSGCKPPIIHRDLKTVNILLDKNMQAKIADFGLSRAFRTDYDTHISTDPAGTLGYVDPECQSSGCFNQKSDVYSFGIILFELITGQPALKKDGDRTIHILRWVTPLIERGDIERIVDPRLRGLFQNASAWKAVEVAMSCVPAAAVQRPDMGLVLSELKECMTQEITGPHIRRLGTGNRSYSIEMSSLDVSEVSPDAR